MIVELVISVFGCLVFHSIPFPIYFITEIYRNNMPGVGFVIYHPIFAGRCPPFFVVTRVLHANRSIMSVMCTKALSCENNINVFLSPLTWRGNSAKICDMISLFRKILNNNWNYRAPSIHH